MAEFVFDARHNGWMLEIERASICITKRPSYCDRGHWVATVSGIPDIDGADAFPRYFMNLDRAKAECKEWLVWRLACEKRR